MAVKLIQEDISGKRDNHTLIDRTAIESATGSAAKPTRINIEQSSIKSLQENLEVLETLFSNTHFLVALLDKDFNFIRVNKAYSESSGKLPEYFFGKNYFELYPHRENKAVFRRVLTSGQSYTEFEKPFKYPDRLGKGMTYWDWSLHPVKREGGEVMGLILSLVDVTRRKRAEEEIKVRNKRFQDLLEQNLDGFIRMDMLGYIVESNPAFRNMVEYTEDELKSLSNKDLTPVGWVKKEERVFNGLLNSKHTSTYEKEYISKNGNTIPVEISLYLTRDDQGNPTEMCAFVRDISEKKETEEEIQGYISRLEQSNRELSEFAYVASHDLQEPLRKIQTFGDRLIKKYTADLSETGRDYLERMVGAATRMRNLIEALLSYSRISSQGKQFTPVDLNTVLMDVMSNLEERIEATGAKLEITELPVIEGDYTQILRLMQNLIGNALKFHQEGVKPLIRICYRIKQKKSKLRRKSRSERTFCEIYVQDNGIGLEKDYQNEIFAPFQRLHGRSEYEGVGMGLAICRRIVERHEGAISVESQAGKGSTFKITLPLPKAGSL